MSSFIKRNQQSIFIGILLFAGIFYVCHPWLDGIVRPGGNQQFARYSGPRNTPCDAWIHPSGSIFSGKSAKLEVDELSETCDRQLSLPASSAATITRLRAALYQVSFVPQQVGSLEFTFQSADGSSTPYIYKYKADPVPIVALLLEVIVLTPAVTIVIVLMSRRIRAAKEQLSKRNETAVAQASAEFTAAESSVTESPSEDNAVFAVTAPAWLDPTVVVLTQYGKLVASVTAVVYLAGIFVVNAYLSQWGSSDYSLLKPRALLAGLWFLFFLSLCILPMRMFFGNIFKPFSSPVNDGTVLFLLKAFGKVALLLIRLFLAMCFSAIPLTIVSAFIFFGEHGGGVLGSSEFFHVVAFILGAQFFGAIIGENIFQFVRRLARGKAKTEGAGQAAMTALALVGFLLFFAFVFARVIYWKIPDAFGGGGVHEEAVTFKDLDPQTSASLQKDANCVGKTSGTYDVAFSGDSYILLACRRSKKIFRLDRKYIVAESWPLE